MKKLKTCLTPALTIITTLALAVVAPTTPVAAQSAFIVPCTASNCWNVYGTVTTVYASPPGTPTFAIIVRQDGTKGQVRVECPNSTTTGCADLTEGTWVVIRGGIFGTVGQCYDGPNNEVQAVDVWRWTGSAWQLYDKEQQAWVVWP